jgi:BMFP domain-containing protein YqiC
MMQTENKILDDLAQFASGAAGSLGDVKTEIEARAKDAVERLAERLDLVTRDEFEVVKALAAEARVHADRLESRVVELEVALSGGKTSKKKSAKKKAANRGAAKKS